MAPRPAAADERDRDAGRTGDEDGRNGHHFEPQRRRQRGAQERRGRFDLTVKIRGNFVSLGLCKMKMRRIEKIG